MAGISDLISAIPIGDLAKRLGVDEATASDVVGKAVPALLGGMRANTESGGASALEKAVSGHSSALVDGGVDLDQVDTADGKKIVSHVFGGSQSKVAAALGSGSDRGTSDLLEKALPMLAPIVMSYLAKKSSTSATTSTAKTGTSKTTTTKPSADRASGGIADLLGGLLGAGNSGGGLADLLGGLGGLLGGGSK